jgi:hypothetical protein
MNHAEFHTHLHECLDARRDPLDDPELSAFLADHPRELEGFVALRERLAALPLLATPAPAPVDRAWRATPWLLLGVVAAAAMLTIWWSTPTAAAAPRGRVLAASLCPIRPTLAAAATSHARTVLLTRPDAHLEVFIRWSTP